MTDDQPYRRAILDHLVANRVTFRRSPYKVDPSVHALGVAAAIGKPAHDVIHVLWGLQKLDAIRFRERKRASPKMPTPIPANGSRVNLSNFQITAIGMELAKELHGSPDLIAQAIQAPVVMADPTPAMARALDHGTPGPVASAILAERPTAPAPTPLLDHLVGKVNGADLPLASLPMPLARPAPLSPLLVDLLARHRARMLGRDAAAAMEAAGMVDLALAMMEALPDDPLETAIAEHLIGEGYG